MNKTSIKVIKRKDAEEAANAKTRSASDVKQSAPVNGGTIESRSHRLMVGTISDWISERRENNRIEGLAAVRKFLAANLC